MNRGSAVAGQRFPIRFEAWYRWLSSALLLLPSRSHVDVTETELECRMGWAFEARVPRSAVVRAGRFEGTPLSRGVHGFGGRWLVNGAGAPIVAIDLAPAQGARVLGVPVKLRQLLVSVDDPDRLIDLLSTRSGAG